MAQAERERKNNVAKLLIKCLAVEGTTPRFRWMEYTELQWDPVQQMLRQVLAQGTEIHQDPVTLEHLFDAWIGIEEDTRAHEAERRELNTAMLTALQDLQFEDTGREAWYNHVKLDAEANWDPNADAQVQDWVTKLTRILRLLEGTLEDLKRRFEIAQNIVATYAEFERLKDQYTAPGLVVEVMLGTTDIAQVRTGVQTTITTINNWVDMINTFYVWDPARDTRDRYKMFFSGDGFVPKDIEWEDFRVRVQNGQGVVTSYILRQGGRRMSTNDVAVVRDGIVAVGESLVRIMEAQRANPRDDNQADDRNRNHDRDGDRESDTERYRRIRRMLLEEVCDEYNELVRERELLVAQDGEQTHAALDLTENQVKTKMMVNDNFLSTFNDLKKNDPHWTTIRRVRLRRDDPNTIQLFDMIMEMRTRLEDRERHFQDVRKDEQLKKTNQLKIIEEQMKEGNRVIYRDKKDFIAWSHDMTVFLESLPDTVEDSQKMSYIRRTIENKETKEILETCETSEEMLNLIAERHIDDVELIPDLFKPIYAAKLPTSYAITYKNIDTIIRTLKLLKAIRMMSKITVDEYDQCIKKAFHRERKQKWNDHIATSRTRIGQEEVNEADKTTLEKRGMVDIPALMRRRNTNQSVEDRMNRLYDYLLDEQYVIMNCKSEEEREKGGVKRQTHSMQEEETSFDQDQESALYYQQFGQRGGFNRGRTMQRGNQGGGRGMNRGGARGRSMAPMKYPIDPAALKKAIEKQGPGKNPPMCMDCPLKCKHALPYGSCEYCVNFENKSLMEKQDIVKKNQLCRKCLRRPPIPHLAKDCKAPNCEKCGGDHNTLICNKPQGTQELHTINVGKDLYTTDDIYGEQDESVVQAIAKEYEQFQQNEECQGHAMTVETPEDDESPFDQGIENTQCSIQLVNEGMPDLDKDEEMYNYTYACSDEETLQFKIAIDDGYELEQLERLGQETPSSNKANSKDLADAKPEDDRHFKRTHNDVGGSDENQDATLRKTVDGTSHLKLGEQNTSRVPDSCISLDNESRPGYSNELPLDKENTYGGQTAETAKQPTDIAKKPSTKQRDFTFMERIWARVPAKQEDWAKTILTQERQWGDQQNMIWNHILKEADIVELMEPIVEEKDEGPIVAEKTCFASVLEPRKIFDPLEIETNRYTRYNKNEDYMILREATCTTEHEKEIFERCKAAGIALKKLFPGVRGMTSKIDIIGQPIAPTKDIRVKGPRLITTTALFDSGSDMGCHTKQLAESVKMKDLPSEFTILRTASGTERKYFNKKAIKIQGQIAADNKAKVHTFESMEVERGIGHEKKHMKPYVHLIADLTGMNNDIRQHFLSQCENNEDGIHVIIGQRDGGMLMNEVHPEQLGLKQHHLLPNVVMYQNGFTGNLILAGDLGINEKLIDKDYPMFYIHKTNWKKMITAKETGNEELLSQLIGENIDPKRIRELSKEPVSQEIHAIKIKKEAEEEIQGENLEPQEAVQHTLNVESANYYMDMSGLKRDLNETYADDDSDEYILNHQEFDKASRYINTEEEETILGFTNMQAEELKRFMEAESVGKPEMKCETCRKRECAECNMMRDKFSAEDRRMFNEVWANTGLVMQNGKQRVLTKYSYRNDPHTTFAKENSNMKEAKARSDGLIKKLIKKGHLEMFQKELQKKIDTGTLVEMKEDELKEVLDGTHHFSYLSYVSSETSTTTSTRLINDTLTSNGKGTSFSLENKVPTAEIGDSFASLAEFRLYRHGYSSDISKCYLRVLVDDLTAKLRLCYWYRDPANLKEPIVFKRCTMDFGDSIASLVIRIIQLKFLLPATRIKLVKDVIKKGAYADNYSSSYRTLREYNLVKHEMERIHSEIGLPLKATYSDIETDPEVKARIEKGEDSTYTFLGITWNLLTNTILPNIYFNMTKKSRGTSGVKKLVDMTKEDFMSKSFLWGISRRIVSRLTAQAYSRLGVMLGPIVMALKILTSRACEIMGPDELDEPIASKDANFARTIAKICQELPQIKNLKPFKKEAVPKGAEVTGFDGYGDGGAPGYAGNWYIISKDDQATYANMISNKSKVSKRTVPANETLARPLQMDMMKELAKAYEYRDEITQRELMIRAIGDSACTACLFNPQVDIRNVLLRSAIWTAKQRAREIIEILPKAKVQFLWAPGVQNTADYSSKLHTNLVETINADKYRMGGHDLLNQTEHVCFYEVSNEGERYMKLPEHLIEGVRNKEAELRKMDPTRTMSNNKIEKEETNVLTTCQEDGCEVHAITRSRANEVKNQDDKSSTTRPIKARLVLDMNISRQWGHKVASQSNRPILEANVAQQPKRKDNRIPEAQIAREEREDEKLKPELKKVVRRAIYYKARRRAIGKNLFNPNKTYKLKGTKMNLEILKNKTFGIDNMLAIGRYLVPWKHKISLEEAREEIWRKMLITAQEEIPPKPQKPFNYEKIQGVIALTLRVPQDKARDIWGGKILPVISGESTLGRKLIREAHRRNIHGFGDVHQGVEATIATLQSGEKAVSVPQARQWVTYEIMNCRICNESRKWSYTCRMQDKYTRNTVDARAFKEISIDMLGGLDCKTFPGSRTTYKVYPLLVKCQQTSALWACLMEEAKTKEVVKGLIKLELEYGEITLLSRDAGSNLHPDNVDPQVKLESADTPRRLLDIIQHYVAPTDGQFRNYSERSTAIFKKMMNNLAKARKDMGFPALTKTSLELILAVAADTCNKIPYGVYDGMYLCPGDLLGQKDNEIRIEETSSKLADLNTMMRNLTQYFKMVNNGRNEILRQNLRAFGQGILREGKGVKELKAKEGDLVLVKDSENEKRGIYGVIDGFESEGTVRIRTKKGIIQRAVAQLIPLAGDCLAKQE